mgnify:CR=1 FL=1
MDGGVGANPSFLLIVAPWVRTLDWANHPSCVEGAGSDYSPGLLQNGTTATCTETERTDPIPHRSRRNPTSSSLDSSESWPGLDQQRPLVERPAISPPILTWRGSFCYRKGGNMGMEDEGKLYDLTAVTERRGAPRVPVPIDVIHRHKRVTHGGDGTSRIVGQREKIPLDEDNPSGTLRVSWWGRHCHSGDPTFSTLQYRARRGLQLPAPHGFGSTERLRLPGCVVGQYFHHQLS